ncbi:hypothetical protein GEMRC1_004357 [Eukaryota sp. GEM-RC1]
MADNNLSFKVVQCSSEDPSHPAVVLHQSSGSPTSHHGGWYSADYSPMPQEITFALSQPSYIQNIQILCHEYIIPSRIEVFLGSSPPLQQSSSYTSATFKRLGHFSLSPNSHTKYKARELKTVKVDQDAQFIRLVLFKCHANDLNTLNKVALLKVKVLGCVTDSDRPIISESIVSDGLVPHKGVPREAIQPVIDGESAKQIKYLLKLKSQALASEDYDKCEELKQLIDVWRAAGERILKLENEKQRAVSVENYQEAKRIKFEIQSIKSKLKTESDTPIPSNLPPIAPRVSPRGPVLGSPHQRTLSNSSDPVIEVVHTENYEDSFDEDAVSVSPEMLVPQSPPKIESPSKVIHPDDRPIKPMQNNPFPVEEKVEIPRGSPKREVKREVLVKRQPGVKNPDERPIKPLNQSQPLSETSPFVDQQSAISDDDSPPVPKLSSKDRDRLGDVMAVGGDEVGSLLASKHWQHRLLAAERLVSLLHSGQGPSRGYFLALETFAQDKHTAVLIGVLTGKPEEGQPKSIETVGLLLREIMMNGNKLSPPLKPSDLIGTASLLIGRLADSNIRTNSLCRHCLDCISSFKPEYADLVIISGINLFLKNLAKSQGVRNVAKLGKLLSAPLISIIDSFHSLPQSHLFSKQLSEGLERIIPEGLLHVSVDVRNSCNELLIWYADFFGLNKATALLPSEKSLSSTPEVLKFLRVATTALQEKMEKEMGTTPTVVETPVPEKPRNQPSRTKKVTPKANEKGKEKAKEKPAENKTKPAEKPKEKPKEVAPPPEEVPRTKSPDGYMVEESLNDHCCEYCGFSLLSEEELDLHWFNVCPYMTSCPSCNQIILVELLNNHLLEECQGKGNYRACTKCQEAVAKSKYKQHVQWKNCAPADPSLLRCPLCHLNIDESVWHEHVESGCKSNSRIKDFQKALEEVGAD